ncbi:MAG: hypothetical protein KC613_05085, partial [Myxococcales bacterium]|nr:hypothetical protein [Myxococcales bacterium]
MADDPLSPFAPRAFGWRAGRQAAQAVRAATDALVKADDPASAVGLVSRLWPACMQVNRAHGDLDDAVERAAEVLTPLWLAHAADPAAHDARLEALWAAIEADRGGLTDPFAERWGTLCAERARADAWAKRLLPEVRKAWARDPAARAPAALPCLSALAAARKGAQLLAMFAV